MNSRNKGKRGELEIVHILKEYGYNNARRGQQYSGANGDPDVVGLDDVHLEIKRVEHLNLYNAMEQSKNDCREKEIPTVFHRKNNKQWLVTMELADWMEFYQAYERILTEC